MLELELKKPRMECTEDSMSSLQEVPDANNTSGKLGKILVEYPSSFGSNTITTKKGLVTATFDNIDYTLSQLTLATSSCLLLTPYLHHCPQELSSRALHQDPFEYFARQIIAEIGIQVQHVPYVARWGLSQIHLDMLSRTSMVIIIVGRSDSASTHHNDREYMDLVEDQMRIASRVGHLSSRLGPNAVLISFGLAPQSIKFAGRRIELENWGDISTVCSILV
jgi:hypothetical protein